MLRLHLNPHFLTRTLLPFLCCRLRGSSYQNDSYLKVSATLQQQDPDPQEQLSPVRIFYRSFDELQGKRILAADRHPPEDGHDATARTALPCINVQDLNKAALQMKSASIIDENSNGIDALDFQKLLQENGGWCLVELLDEQVPVMDAMWDCIVRLHEIGTYHATMRRQVLSRRKDSDIDDEGTSQGGYNHLEIALVNGTCSISRIQEILGKQSCELVDEAFRLIGGIGAAFCAAASGQDLTTLQCLWDDTKNDTPFAGSSQRLARYSDAPDMQESLRSHCDWSFATIVPVSDLAGLEVYNPSERCWVRPELRALDALSSNDENNYRWNSRFVVVMTGKWLELLCRGHLSSTIHRVTRANRRYSAPFFLRPTAQIFDRAEFLQLDARNWESCVALLSDFLLEETVERH